MNEQYLDFDEAVAFLKTNSSTLYKWLQNGKVPGYKLGRQWRFLKDELELHISGKIVNVQTQQDALTLTNLLQSRSTIDKLLSPTDLVGLAEALIWDGFYHAATAIHLAPLNDTYSVTYRTHKGIDNVISISEAFFATLHQALQNLCEPAGSDDKRRAYLQRNEDDACLVAYQLLDTRMGPHITLQLFEPYRDIPALDKIVKTPTDYTTFTQWLQHKSGIIVISGAWGSGKTTTVLSCLDHLKDQGKIIFTLEEDENHLIEGVHQIELKSSQIAEFEQSFSKIMASDPDVVCFILNNYTGLKDVILQAAYRAAALGHLVILHLHAASCDTVLNNIQTVISEAVAEKLLIGIASQKLLPDGPNRKAQYDLMSF